MIAAGLDVLSNVFGDEILPTLMPIIQAKLATSGDAAWKDREATVLAHGVVAKGCINGLYPHLSEVIFCWMILIFESDCKWLVRNWCEYNA
ncbi:hypothetical protein Pint_27472 [Pistacia integerrima]|uniref:Uncharacterized protein n=1 Tax=Pistacia integerrima TaxID=434235 RepID=A0ACC0YNG2_9ROSI|nr:hypothetical protein Pint_27472 [Pistacia integerrima]